MYSLIPKPQTRIKKVNDACFFGDACGVGAGGGGFGFVTCDDFVFLLYGPLSICCYCKIYIGFRVLKPLMGNALTI